MLKKLEVSHFKAQSHPAFSQSPAVGKLSQRLAEACTMGLLTIRSAPWRTTVESISENIELQLNSEATQIRFESERGSLTMLLQMDRPAISALLEAAMGGSGAERAFAMNERPLSRIEQGVLRLAYQGIGEKISVTLSEMLGRPFSLFTGEAVEGPAPGTAFAQLRFTLNIYSHSGEITFVFQVAELQRQLNASECDDSNEMDSPGRQLFQQEVGKSDVVLTVTLQPEMVMLEKITQLHPGKLIELSVTADMPVILSSGGIATHEAVLGRQGTRLAVTITSAVE